MITATSHGNIVAILENDTIIIEDVEEGHRYTVDANCISINELGNETDMTWREVMQAGKIIIQNDDMGGHSWGQHGSIFVRE